VEQPDVAELLAKAITADLLGRRPRARHGRNAVPDGGNPGPFVSGELVQKREKQGLAVEAPGIIHYPEVISVKALRIGQRAAAPDRQVLELRQSLLLSSQVLFVFENFARMILTVDPVVLKVVAPLAGPGWTEDGSVGVHLRTILANALSCLPLAPLWRTTGESPGPIDARWAQGRASAERRNTLADSAGRAGAFDRQQTDTLPQGRR